MKRRHLFALPLVGLIPTPKPVPVVFWTRQQGKIANFALNYGQSYQKVSQDLLLSVHKAVRSMRCDLENSPQYQDDRSESDLVDA